MIYIICMFVLLQGCFALPENCSEPIKSSVDFGVLQKWPGGANGQFDFGVVENIENSWAVLIKLRGSYLLTGRAIISGMLTEDIVNENGTAILFKNIAPTTVALENFSFFASFSGFYEGKISDVIEIAVLFNVQDGICVDIEYPTEMNNELSEGSEAIGLQMDLYSNCSHAAEVLKIDNHIWANGDLFNMQGNFVIDNEADEWAIKVLFDQPIAGIQAWAVTATQDVEGGGHIWYFTPNENTNSHGHSPTRAYFVATLIEEIIPTALAYMCYSQDAFYVEELLAEDDADITSESLLMTFEEMKAIRLERQNSILPSTLFDEFRSKLQQSQ